MEGRGESADGAPAWLLYRQVGGKRGWGSGGVGGPSMHTLAVLRRTNCFSLRQISCKSRLRRQHCPGLPGRRDGRQADGGARGRDGGGRGGGAGE